MVQTWGKTLALEQEAEEHDSLAELEHELEHRLEAELSLRVTWSDQKS